mmetsp:Transcript_28948/g.46633  ORF Transcript_28948/g.46633 Transcript_28948/m.46633 type:complete len:1709 (+) Transcript_28948:84-5210(+)
MRTTGIFQVRGFGLLISRIVVVVQLVSSARNSTEVLSQDNRGRIEIAVERYGRLQASTEAIAPHPTQSLLVNGEADGIIRQVEEVLSKRDLEGKDFETQKAEQKLVDKAWRIWFVDEEDSEDPDVPDEMQDTAENLHHPYFVNDRLIDPETGKISQYDVPLVWLQKPMSRQLWPIGDPKPCQVDRRKRVFQSGYGYQSGWEVAGMRDGKLLNGNGELPFGWLAWWYNRPEKMPSFNKNKTSLQTLPPGYPVYQSIFTGKYQVAFPTQNIVEQAFNYTAKNTKIGRLPEKEHIYIEEYKDKATSDTRLFQIFSPNKHNTLLEEVGGPYLYEEKLAGDKVQFEWLADREKRNLEKQRKEAIANRLNRREFREGEICVLKGLQDSWQFLNDLEVQIDRPSDNMVRVKCRMTQLEPKRQKALAHKLQAIHRAYGDPGSCGSCVSTGEHEDASIGRCCKGAQLWKRYQAYFKSNWFSISANKLELAGKPRCSLFPCPSFLANPFRITPVEQGGEPDRIEEYRLCNLDKRRKLCTQSGPFFGKTDEDECVPPISLSELQHWFCNDNDFSENTCRYWFFIQCEPVEYRIDPITQVPKTLNQLMTEERCASEEKAREVATKFQRVYKPLELPERRLDPSVVRNTCMALSEEEFELKHRNEKRDATRDEILEAWNSPRAKHVKSIGQAGGTIESQFQRFLHNVKSEQDLLKEASRLKQRNEHSARVLKQLESGDLFVKDILDELDSSGKEIESSDYVGVPFGGSKTRRGKGVKENDPTYVWTFEVQKKLAEALPKLYASLRRDDLKSVNFLDPVEADDLAKLKHVSLKDTTWSWGKLWWWEKQGVIMRVEWTLNGIRTYKNALPPELRPKPNEPHQILTTAQCDHLVKHAKYRGGYSIHKMVMDRALIKHKSEDKERSYIYSQTLPNGIQLPKPNDPCPLGEGAANFPDIWIYTPEGISYLLGIPAFEEWIRESRIKPPEVGQFLSPEVRTWLRNHNEALQKMEVKGYITDEPAFEWNDVGGITLAAERSRHGKLFHKCLPSESKRQVTLEQRKVMLENNILPEDYVYEGLFLQKDFYRWSSEAIDHTPQLINKAATLKEVQKINIPDFYECPPVHNGLVNSIQYEIITADGENIEDLKAKNYVYKDAVYSWTEKVLDSTPAMVMLNKLLSGLPAMYRTIAPGRAVNSLQLSILKHTCHQERCGEVNLNQLQQDNYIRTGLQVEKIAQPELQKQQLQSALVHKYNQLLDYSTRITFGGREADVSARGHGSRRNGHLMSALMSTDMEEARQAEMSLLVGSKRTLELCGFPCAPEVKMLAPSNSVGIRIYKLPIADNRYLLAPDDVFKFDQMFVASGWPSPEDIHTWEKDDHNFSVLRARAYGLKEPHRHGPQYPNLLPRWYKVIFDCSDQVGAIGYVPVENQDNDRTRRYVPALREVKDYKRPPAGEALLQECVADGPDLEYCYALTLKSKLWKPISWTDKVKPWMTPILPKPPLSEEERRQWDAEQDAKFKGLLLMIFNYPNTADLIQADYDPFYSTLMAPGHRFTQQAIKGLTDACEMPGLDCSWEEDIGRHDPHTGMKINLAIPFFFPHREKDNCKQAGDNKDGVCQNHPGAECLLYEEVRDFSESKPTPSCRCGIQARGLNDPGRVPKCPRDYADLYDFRQDSETKIKLGIGKLAQGVQERRASVHSHPSRDSRNSQLDESSSGSSRTMSGLPE